MTPSALLTAAADRLRDLAASATPGPWRQHDTYLDVGGYTATVLSGEPGKGGFHNLRAWLPTMSQEPWDETRNAWADARWIAALSPAVSPALERWLRETAVSLDRHEPKWRDPTAFTELCIPRRSDDEVAALIEHHYGAALALARVVLSAGEEQPDG